MQRLSKVAVCLVAVVVLCGCASTQSKTKTYSVWNVDVSTGQVDRTKIVVGEDGTMVIYNPSRWYR